MSKKMENRREFDLGDILTVTHYKLVSPRHVEGVYDILGYMSGEDLMTHQLPRVGRECRDPLLRQHPQLAAIQEPDFGAAATKESVLGWLDEQKAIYGDTLPVEPLQPGEHEYRDALAELDQIAGTRPVITAHIP